MVVADALARIESAPEWRALNPARHRWTGDRRVLDPAMDTHAIHADLQLADPGKFLLITRGFRWIREYPFHC